MPNGKQTVGGDENVPWHTFDEIDEPRLMSWEATLHPDRTYIGIGTKGVISVHLNAKVSHTDYELPAGWLVLIANVERFKLVMKD
ncbi:hypothetical protein EAF04_004322 [Stromatinia cepivora]|nr:hypothetical protein EAF04_004322 [Stromatinia cepivora]